MSSRKRKRKKNRMRETTKQSDDKEERTITLEKTAPRNPFAEMARQRKSGAMKNKKSYQRKGKWGKPW